MVSPYEGHPESQRLSITKDLVDKYPLTYDEIVEAVLEAWDGILMLKIAGALQIGVDIFPAPKNNGKLFT